MLKNPKDRRAVRTASQIKEVMLDFMEKKAIHEISVSELCKVCQINRATFYDHYRDVFDLVQDMESDILMQLQELMELVKPEQTPAEEVSNLFFGFLEEHRHQMKLLLSGERSWEFSQRLDAMIMPFFEQKVRQNYHIPDGKEHELQGTLQFVATGYYRFFMQTLVSESKHSTADASLCAQLSDACLSSMFQIK